MADSPLRLLQGDQVALRIEDYGVIGDCHTMALVGNNGSIDWLCMPRFDSAACFANLLGDEENGYWKIAPDCEVRKVSRRYLDHTLILETTFECDSGVVKLTDFMPPRGGEPDLIRIVEGISGEVPMRMEFVLRFDYGHITPWVRRTEDGLSAIAGPEHVYLRTPVELTNEDFRTTAHFTARTGERTPFTYVWTPSHTPDPPNHDPFDELDDTYKWWHEWSEKCTYDGEYHDPVMRSLLVLKGLTYQPTGGVCAAATTSLPEDIGGERNWDYRYCWLRDATFTLFALIKGGYTDEARSWREWLIRAAAGRPDELQIMYGLSGERRLTEAELDWLSGYEESRPVRIGNAAYSQHQLDVYGELMDALQLARNSGLEPDENAWRVQQGVMQTVEKIWREPDEGIWEIRGPRQHFVHSKVMAWVAADRAYNAVTKFGFEGDAEKWDALRRRIKSEVMAQGYDPKLNSFTQYYGSEELDASLLMLPLVGFLPASDPMMRGTTDAIRERLCHDEFVKRYDCGSDVDGLSGSEGTFLICTFWMADNLAMRGDVCDAKELFEKLLSVRNDLGLLSEEYDPHTQRLLGNYPQAFSHLGLINTACHLSSAAEDMKLESERYVCEEL